MNKKSTIQTSWEALKGKLRTLKSPPSGYETITSFAKAHNVTPAAVRKMLARGTVDLKLACKIKRGAGYRVYVPADALNQTSERRQQQVRRPIPVSEIDSKDEADLELKRIKIEQERHALTVANNETIPMEDAIAIMKTIGYEMQALVKKLREILGARAIVKGNTDRFNRIFDECSEEIMQAIEPLLIARTLTGEPDDS